MGVIVFRNSKGECYVVRSGQIVSIVRKSNREFGTHVIICLHNHVRGEDALASN